jgi:hypothetical protein
MAGARFIGPLPTRGPWTAVGLPRGSFLAILVLSVAAFALIGGPVWRDVHGDHFARIALSYALIVPLVGIAFRRVRPFPLGTAFAAVVLIALVKLVVTAALLALLAIAAR